MVFFKMGFITRAVYEIKHVQFDTNYYIILL